MEPLLDSTTMECCAAEPADLSCEPECDGIDSFSACDAAASCSCDVCDSGGSDGDLDDDGERDLEDLDLDCDLLD